MSLVLQLLGALVLLCSSASAREFRVAVVQFDTRSNEELAFIQSALLILLPSRLSEPRKITVVDHAALLKYLPKGEKSSSLQEKLTAAKKAQADFLLAGSIIKNGGSISIDAQLISVAHAFKQTPAAAPNILIKNLIPEIHAFAQKVRRIIGEHPLPPDPPEQEKKQMQPERQKSRADEIPEDMPYPPMPEKKFSDRFKIQEKEESPVKETTINDFSE